MPQPASSPMRYKPCDRPFTRPFGRELTVYDSKEGVPLEALYPQALKLEREPMCWHCGSSEFWQPRPYDPHSLCRSCFPPPKDEPSASGLQSG